jgi:hypothetical protein
VLDEAWDIRWLRLLESESEDMAGEDSHIDLLS